MIGSAGTRETNPAPPASMPAPMAYSTSEDAIEDIPQMLQRPVRRLVVARRSVTEREEPGMRSCGLLVGASNFEPS